MDLHFYSFEELDSTNLWAKQNRERFDRKALSVVRAAHQTAGRGRLGRRWFSPPHTNLLLTFVCFDIENGDPLQLTHVLAFSLATWLRQHQIFCTIKWPNDVLCKGKKLAGILCENLPSGALLLGLGLNVNMENCSMIDQPATSLFIEKGKPWPLEESYQEICTCFLKDLQLYKKSGFTPFLERGIDIVKQIDQEQLLMKDGP